MNRQQKELLVEELKQSFASSPASFLVNYRGLSVNKVQSLRKSLRANGGKFKVAKARLMKLAVKDIPGCEDLTPYLHDQLGVVFSSQEPTAVAKALYDFAKENENLAIVAGCFESKIVSKNSIEFIASLPSREVLLSQVAGVLQAPVAQVAVMMNALLQKFAWALKELERKKAEGQ